MMTFESFAGALVTRKFTIVQTGGGCTAWSFTYGSGEVLITQDASHEIDAECLQTDGITFSITTDVDQGDFVYFCADSFKRALEVAELASEYVEAHQTAAASFNAIKSFAKEI